MWKMKNYQAFILIIIVFFILLLAWVGIKRYDDFVSYHILASKQATASLADEIARMIFEKKHRVKVIANKYQALLLAQVDDPDNEVISQQIKTELNEHFPDYFAFTLAKAKGEPLLDDFEYNISEYCQQDIRLFAQKNINLPRIHPTPDAYHYDIMSIFTGKQKKYILFVSFKAEILSRILLHSQPVKHNLILTFGNKPLLMEATATGLRYQLARNDYHLSDVENQRILSQHEIAGTSWKVVDLHDPQLFDEFGKTLWWQSMMVFFPFLLLTIIMLYLFREEETLRHRAETAKDEFIATISHELRTPLTAILGSLNLIASGVTGEINKKSAGLIDIGIKNSKRLILLVNDLLDIRKLETGKMDYQMHSLDMAAIIQSAINAVSNYAAQFGCSYKFTPPETPILVRGDENRLIQVMTNLLSNAAKYGNSDDTVLVELITQGRYAYISVSDHGPGIPASYQHMIFEKFSRISSGKNKPSEGTGLGLSIVKTIVKDHKGKVGFYSTMGKGSTFYFTLPLANA